MRPGDRTRLTCPRRSCPQPQAGQIERLGAAPRPEAPPPPTPRASSRACAKAPGLAAQLTKIDVAHARAKRDASGARDDVAAEGEPRRVMDEGFEAVLSRKHRATPAVVRIFDGEKEAKLIALACCKPPKGRARWTLRLLESKVVELRIVDRASDSTIGRALKKTFSSPSPTVLGHPAQGQRRVRSGDGRRAGRLHAATRSQSSAGLPGRDLKATPRRDASDDSDETGRPGPLRLRVRAQWNRQPVHAVRAARRLAPYQRSPHRRGLCSPLEGRGRYPLFRRPDHRSGPGQSQHPQQGVTLPSLSARRSQAAGRAVRMALHAKARQLA